MEWGGMQWGVVQCCVMQSSVVQCNVVQYSIVQCSVGQCSVVQCMDGCSRNCYKNTHVLLTFDKVHNPLPLPHEATSERPRVVRTCGVFNLLPWKRASRHNAAHFFDISTSKRGPTLVCVVDFGLDMCFAPQCRALFRHRNFQKWSGNGVLCTF